MNPIPAFILESQRVVFQLIDFHPRKFKKFIIIIIIIIIIIKSFIPQPHANMGAKS